MIKPSQLEKILAYKKKIEDDVSMLSWKVYSTNTIADDLYSDELNDSTGIDLSLSFGTFVPPRMRAGGYFKILSSSSGVSNYSFPSSSDIIRKPIQGPISNWVSDQYQGVMYQTQANYMTWSSGRVTIRNKINALNWVYSANMIKIQFSAALFPVIIDHVSIGQWRYNTYVGTLDTPTMLTFNNGSPNTSISPSTSVWTDWVPFIIYPGIDYVVITDLADGKIQYAATNDQGFCMYREGVASYSVAEPNESYYLAGPPQFNNYVLPTSIQFTSNWCGGHFTNGVLPVTLDSEGASEVEEGCLVDFGTTTKTIIDIIGDGSDTGGVVLNEFMDSSLIDNIYGTKYTLGVVSVNSSGGIAPTQYQIVKGSSSARLSTKIPGSWSHIPSMIVAQTTPGSSLIYHFISFDGGITWSNFKNSAWRKVARLSSGNWQYNISETSTPSWYNSISNDDMSALKSSLGTAANCMTRTELIAITDAQWISTDGFLPNFTNSLDFAFAMKASRSDTPTFTSYGIDYVVDIGNIDLITLPWTASANNPLSAYCVLSVTVIDSMVPNTDIKVYMSIDDGETYNQIVNLILLSSYGTISYLRGDISDIPQVDDKIIRMRISTFNQRNIQINAISLGLRYE